VLNALWQDIFPTFHHVDAKSLHFLKIGAGIVCPHPDIGDGSIVLVDPQIKRLHQCELVLDAVFGDGVDTYALEVHPPIQAISEHLERDLQIEFTGAQVAQEGPIEDLGVGLASLKEFRILFTFFLVEVGCEPLFEGIQGFLLFWSEITVISAHFARFLDVR